MGGCNSGPLVSRSVCVLFVENVCVFFLGGCVVRSNAIIFSIYPLYNPRKL